MNCRKVRFYLSAYSENMLSSDKAKQLEVHVRNCKSCEQEKFLLDQILATTRTLPSKKVAEDFNLKLLNRIYAEQSNSTESYLPDERLSAWRRPFGWVTAAATLCICALVAIVLMKNDHPPTDSINTKPLFTESTPGVVSQVKASSSEERINTYRDIIGVSGTASRYRATNFSDMKTLRLSDAALESLTVTLQRRMGRGAGTLSRAGSDYSPFQRANHSSVVRNVSSK